MPPVFISLFLIFTSICLGQNPNPSQYSWPPDKSSCLERRTTAVLNQPNCTNNTEVHVAHQGGNGTISFTEFLNKVGTFSNQTYILESSSQPYVWGCRQVNIGPWSATGKKSCITIRGESGRREDVVLVGANPTTNPDFWKSSEYGGSSTCGIGQTIQITNTDHFVMADLTMRNFPGKMIKIDGGLDNGQPWYPSDILLHNLELQDCGSQMIKVAGEPISSYQGILECSFLHYTEALFAESDYETQGIDVHEGQNWIIRDNYFLNFRQTLAQKNGNAAAIIMWDETDTVLAERNLIANCNSAIKLGASWYQDGSDVMTAKNNLIIYDDPNPKWGWQNIFEIGQAVVNGGFYHNTIWNPVGNNGAALAVCSNNFPVESNIYNNGTTNRCGGLKNNFQTAKASDFVNVNSWIFKLSENKTVALNPKIPQDILGAQRKDPTSMGAYDFSGTLNLQAMNTGKGLQRGLIWNSRIPLSIFLQKNNLTSAHLDIYTLAGQNLFMNHSELVQSFESPNIPPGFYFLRTK